MEPAAALTELRKQLTDGLACERLTKTLLAARTGLGRTTVQEAFSAKAPVPSAETVAALAGALKLPVGQLLDLRRVAAGETVPRTDRGPGKPIGEWDPHHLEVHPAGPTTGRHAFAAPERVLSGYVRRPHDQALADAVLYAAQGYSQIVVLVGSSFTGKTRACWEAVRPLAQDEWQLWHPFAPTRAAAALDDLKHVRPRTVVWLNDAQHYLGDPRVGEQIAAAVHTLLTHPERRPVLVLGTLWPEYADQYIAGPRSGAPDPHSRVRELLTGRTLTVPETFDQEALREAADLANGGDRLLADALTRARSDGRVTQDLAGAPELLRRYEHGTPAARAVLEAAMDARRLGVGLDLPQAFLTDAAIDYLSDQDYDALTENWAEAAFADLARPVRGKQAPLRRPRRRPPGKPGPVAGVGDTRPVFRLTDYLEQHGRSSRRALCPSGSFWAAAHTHLTHPDDLNSLAHAAWDRGLYRDAVQLHKHATTHGDPRGPLALIRCFQDLHPTDFRPAEWAAAHAPLTDPIWVVGLLAELRRIEAHDQITTLLAREPAAHIGLTHDNTTAVAHLLAVLREVGAEDQVTALATRAAAHAPLDDPDEVTLLLHVLRQIGAQNQIATLLARDPAIRVGLTRGNTRAVARLLEALREVGAEDQVAALATRAAAHAPLDDTNALGTLLEALWKVGAEDQVAALATRAAAHAPLDDTNALGTLLEALWKVGAEDQVTALATRAAAHAPLDDTREVTRLLAALRRCEASGQLSSLAERVAAQTSLDDANTVAELLDSLRWEGAEEQAAILLARNPAAHAALDDPNGVAQLFASLWRVGAHEQIAVLLARDPAAHVSLDIGLGVASLLATLRGAGVEDQATTLLARDPAAHVDLNDPYQAGFLLEGMTEAGAREQTAALAARAAAHVPITDPDGLDYLVHAMRDAGVEKQAAFLAARVASGAALDNNPDTAARLLKWLREIRASEEQIAIVLERGPASQVTLDNPRAVNWLMSELRGAGAEAQLAALLARDPAAHVALTNLYEVSRLLDEMLEAGAEQQAAALAMRAAIHVPLNDADAIDVLLKSMRNTGTKAENTLAARLPAAGHFRLFMKVGANLGKFRLGRDLNGTPTPSWAWDDLE
jgi:transcriptional regulator with XRE-family HTH domain